MKPQLTEGSDDFYTPSFRVWQHSHNKSSYLEIFFKIWYRRNQENLLWEVLVFFQNMVMLVPDSRDINFCFFFWLRKLPEFYFLAQAFANLHGKRSQGKFI